MSLDNNGELLQLKYREPQPTKKDKTLVEILDRLKSLEGKLDRIPIRDSHASISGPTQQSPSSQHSSAVDADPNSYSYPNTNRLPSYQPSPGRGTRSQPYRHASAAHKMLTWPAIQQLLIQAVPANVGDMRSLEQEGSAFIVRMHQGQGPMPMDECLEETAFLGMQTPATRATGGPRVTFPDLTRDVMQRLANAYFDSFNMLYPFMDRQNFMADILAMVQTEGFDGETESVLALLVFALGELAIEGATGIPVETYKGRPSGVRGGSQHKPPGLSLFNEARKRLGFVLTKCDLENVQIFSLAA
ncbi:hypothetical protein M7I_7983 [Glarea lozoyensis 74030]|uniref:Uncharacterized protein n=1 Tax=Glarea lozoyensis (strain ATCC 74030 / MF5533) TaxID=1104152 RepID=H0EYS4_GLAL7|nr:hypothetical protein M7I_7983 [Glarea lozoyensis 74030]